MYLCGEGRGFKCVCVRITYEETARNLLKSCLSFGESLEGSNEEKMGRQQKEEVP